MMDVRGHTGGIDPQLAPAGHPRPHGQLHHARIQRLQRFGPDEPAPADQRGIVRHAPEIDAREPAQHQAIGHALFRLLEAPGMQVFDQQETQDGLHWGRMPSSISCMRKAPCQVSFDLLKELIIVEQPIQLLQLRVGLPRQFGHRCKDIFWRVAVNEHRTLLLSKLLRRFYRLICSGDKLNQLRPLLTPASMSIGSARSANSGDPLALEPLPRLIPHRKLVLAYHFPEECALVTAQYRAYCTHRSNLRVKEMCEEVRQATLALYSQEITPSLRRVAARLSCPSMMRTKEAKATWHNTRRELGLE